MNIVVEGPDNSGKSTLVRYLATRLGLPVDKGKGPPRSAQEWAERFNDMPPETADVIFDRHTAVSEPIYGPLMRGESFAHAYPHLIRQFYARRRLFVFCRPTEQTLRGHVADHERDTSEHLAQLVERHPMICVAYDVWALEHANIFYRIGDDMACVARLVEAHCNFQMSRRGQFRAGDGLTVLP